MNNSLAVASLALLISLDVQVGHAQPRTMSEQAVVRQTVESNPTVRAAMTDVRRSAELLRAEGARYRPRLLVDAVGSHENMPQIDIVSGTIPQRTNMLNVGAELNQTFSWGTKLALRLDNSNYRFEGPLYRGQTDVFVIGPVNVLQARLSITQPLLRGFGNEVGLAELRSALLDRCEQERARDATASEALSSALQAYWELWFAHRTLAIENEARTLASQQRDETERKVRAGSMAEVDLLSYETRLAELDQNVLDAEVGVRIRSVELRRALGTSGDDVLEVSAGEPPAIEVAESKPTLLAAEESSYTITRLRLTLERSQTMLRSAADATRARLDLTAWVQAAGVGNKSFSAALGQLGAFDNLSGNLGVSLELPVSSEQHRAQLAAAQLAVRSAEEQLHASIQQVRADTERELTSLAQAQQKIALAERTTDVSRRSADAQQKRFLAGTALALEVRTAEDALRRARLGIERHRVDAIKAQIRLAQLTGKLLAKWGLSLEG